MFKKREKSANALKRTLEDRYQDELQAKDEEPEVQDLPAKRQKHDEKCTHKHALNKVSTKDHQHYR
jgi:hypothetical protein